MEKKAPNTLGQVAVGHTSCRTDSIGKSNLGKLLGSIFENGETWTLIAEEMFEEDCEKELRRGGFFMQSYTVCSDSFLDETGIPGLNEEHQSCILSDAMLVMADERSFVHNGCTR